MQQYCHRQASIEVFDLYGNTFKLVHSSCAKYLLHQGTFTYFVSTEISFMSFERDWKQQVIQIANLVCFTRASRNENYNRLTSLLVGAHNNRTQYVATLLHWSSVAALPLHLIGKKIKQDIFSWHRLHRWLVF